MQQHSTPSHSRHFVFPADPSPLTILPMVEAAADPGPFISTRVILDDAHMLGFGGEWGLVYVA